MFAICGNGVGSARDYGEGDCQWTLRRAVIAYILQDTSVFPDMTVAENLWMGGYLLDSPAQAQKKAEQIFAQHERLAVRRR